MKVKLENLKVGDVIYPISEKIGQDIIISCGKITETHHVFKPETFESIDIKIIDIWLNETHTERALTDENEEYNVIYREKE